MTSSNIDLSKFPVLQGQQNYADWAAEVQSTAMLRGFWPAFIGQNTASTGADAAEVDRVNQREWKARGLILKTSSTVLCNELLQLQQMVVTGSTTTPRDYNTEELWVHLHTKFQMQSGISTALDVQRLITFQFIDDGTLEAQLNRHQEIRARCALNKFTFKDGMYATYILLALLESYQAVKDSFFATSDLTTIKPADVRARIIKTKIRRKAESVSSANALMLKQQGPGHKPK